MVERDLRKLTRGVEKDLRKLSLGEISREKRVPLPSKTKNVVYGRAKRRCERCGMPLKMKDKGAQFHHLREPTVKSRPSTIQFLCATCHMNHGHVYKSRASGYDPFTGRPIKKTVIVRKKVRKNPSSPWWKMKPRTATKKTKRKTTSKKTKPKKKTTTKKAKKRPAKRRRPKTPLERLTKQIEKDFF